MKHKQPTPPPPEKLFMAIDEIQMSNLTLWHYFAAHAPCGGVAFAYDKGHPEEGKPVHGNDIEKHMAAFCANFADAMIAEIERRKG